MIDISGRAFRCHAWAATWRSCGRIRSAKTAAGGAVAGCYGVARRRLHFGSTGVDARRGDLFFYRGGFFRPGIGAYNRRMLMAVIAPHIPVVAARVMAGLTAVTAVSTIATVTAGVMAGLTAVAAVPTRSAMAGSAACGTRLVTAVRTGASPRVAYSAMIGIRPMISTHV